MWNVSHKSRVCALWLTGCDDSPKLTKGSSCILTLTSLKKKNFLVNLRSEATLYEQQCEWMRWLHRVTQVAETDSDRKRWVTCVGGRWGGVDESLRQTRGALRALVRCHLGVEWERMTTPAPVIWSKVSPRQCDSVAPECCFQPPPLSPFVSLLEDESLNFSPPFIFWRGSRFCAAMFPHRREHWSAARPHTRAAVGLIGPSGELLF